MTNAGMMTEIMARSDAVVLTLGQISLIVTIGIFVMGVIITIISKLLQTSVFNKLTETDNVIKDMKTSVTADINKLAAKLTEFKEEVIKEYVRRDELGSNDTAHKEFYEKMGKANERIAVMESEIRSLKANSYQYRRELQMKDRRGSDEIPQTMDGG